MSSSPKISYLPIIITIVVVMVGWFFFAPKFNSPPSNETDGEINFDIVIDTDLIPDCSKDNPLCRDQIDALAKLEDYIKTQNTLIKYPIFNGNLYEDQKKEIENLKKQSDKEYFENYFFDAAQGYIEARTKLNKILGNIEKVEAETISSLDELFNEKKYDQMNALIVQLENYSFNVKQIESYIYKKEKGPKYDTSISSSLTAFRLEKYKEAINFVNTALELFPENQEAKKLKIQIEAQLLDLNTNNAVADIKSLLFKTDLTISDLNTINQKVDDLKILNRAYDVEDFYKEINLRKKNINFNKFQNEAVTAFNNKNFTQAISSFNSAQKIKSLNSDSVFKLNISKNVLELLSSFNEILYGKYDLKKQSNLDLLEKKIQESKKIYQYSPKLEEITNEAEKIFFERNKFIKIKILSNELFFVDIGTLKLGSFEEKNIELRPGEYEILVKRRGKATSRTEIEIPSNSSTITFQIICSESKCSVNKE